MLIWGLPAGHGTIKLSLWLRRSDPACGTSARQTRENELALSPLPAVADGESEGVSIRAPIATIIQASLGRPDQRDSTSAVLAVDLEVCIEREHGAATELFRHPDERGIRDGHRDVGILHAQLV